MAGLIKPGSQTSADKKRGTKEHSTFDSSVNTALTVKACPSAQQCSQDCFLTYGPQICCQARDLTQCPTPLRNIAHTHDAIDCSQRIYQIIYTSSNNLADLIMAVS